MGRLLGSIFGLRRDERRVAILMAVYHFLLLVSLYLLKPVRDSLFLSIRGADELPFVFILTTIAVMPVAYVHARAGRRMTIGPLIDGVSLLLVASLVGLRVLMGIGGAWVAYLLYAWVSIYGLLVTSQFWLLANALFTASQAKRVFPLLSAGAIVGAIAGGEITGLLVNVIDVTSENLLWGAGGVLLGATGVGVWGRQLARSPRGTTTQPPKDQPADGEETPGALSVIADSRHIQFIVGILTLMVMVTTLVDYQFKTVAAQTFASEEALTTFMGQFYGRVSIVAMLVQFVVVPRLMRMGGIGGALSVLPGVLALGTVGMLVMPGLVAGVFLRGAGQSFKHSVDKTGRELLFVPVSLEKKKRVKVFIDLFVDQGAQGLGGLLLLALAFGAGVSVQMLSIGTLVLIAIWGFLTYGVRQTYVDQFRTKLRKQQRGTEGTGDTDAEGEEDLLDALCSHAEADVRRALDVLEKGQHPVPIDAVLCLLDHPTTSVRAQALRVLRHREVEDVGETVATALRDSDPDVQLEAARYLYSQLTDNHLERLRQALEHDDPQIQAAAVGLIAEEGGIEEYRLVSEPLLRRLVETEGIRGQETRTQVARILGVLDRSYRDELLHQLLKDESPTVVRAAIRAAGRSGERTFVPRLVAYLGDEAFASSAQQALASFGPLILGTLYDHLTDESLPLRTRLGLPSIFAANPSRLGFTLLVRSLSRINVPLRHAVVRALSKTQAAGHFEADPDRLDQAIDTEIEQLAAFGQIRRLYQKAPGAPDAFFTAQQLEAFRDETLESIFRLLGVRYDQRDFYDAYLGLTSGDLSLHDSAVEFVDNLVEYRTRRMLLPLFDDPRGQGALGVGQQFFDLRIRNWKEAQDYVQRIDDPRVEQSRSDLLQLSHAGPLLEESAGSRDT